MTMLGCTVHDMWRSRQDGKIWQPQSREMPRMTEKDVRSHSGTSAIVVLSVKKEHLGRTCWARTCWLRTVQVETL